MGKEVKSKKVLHSMAVKSPTWYEGLNHMQLFAALALPPQQFPHGTPGDNKKKRAH